MDTKWVNNTITLNIIYIIILKRTKVLNRVVLKGNIDEPLLSSVYLSIGYKLEGDHLCTGTNGLAGVASHI